MPVLHLSLLGTFEACLGGQSIYNFRTNKVQALLIYLAVERNRPHPREALMTLLWPDMPLESAQVNLRQTVYRLRQAIPQVDSKSDDSLVPLLLSDRQMVQLNPQGELRVDVDEFQVLIEQDPVQAVDRYRGDFLADFYLSDSNQFELWAETIRQKTRQQALMTLSKLTVDSLQYGDYPRAQTLAWRQIEVDHFCETAYRQLMLALAKNGQRSAALSQYQVFRSRLNAELDVEPSSETAALYQRIQADAQRQIETIASDKKPAKTSAMPVFLLTDIENSTRLWDTHRQAMLTALLRHNAILEKQIDQHGGRILELRGDGVKAVFETVNPLPCVLGIQKEFGATDWGEIGALKIRMGLHGVPTVHKDFDYFEENDKYYGPVLNHTARVMDAGWGGQILVSEQVHHAFPLPPGAGWEDFDLHTLKSLDQPVHIYGLIHPDLPQKKFPPLRTLSTPDKATPVKSPTLRHNLEPQLTTFVGRCDELEILNGMLSAPNIRLITIVGPGGMGKTRLAIEAAEIQLDQAKNPKKALFPDGIFFVSLTSLSDHDQIVLAIAKAIDLPFESVQSSEKLERTTQPQTSDSILEKVIGYLQNKFVLLVLDNFEHLLDGAGILPGILQAAPHIKCLVTSRERLHLREEQVFSIQGLEYPDWEAPENPFDFTAMELFLQSAHRVRPDFELTSDEMVYLTRICQLVGGMPLGLELAASWVDLLSLQDIATEIQGSLDFLETDIRNMPDRHRSLRAVFESSWGRLSDTEQKIFPRLSIFRGSFSREAVQKIARASIRDLAVLVSKSLLQYNQTTNCYQIHELLRQFGAEKLEENLEDAIKTRDLHSTYYCDQIQYHFGYLLEGKSRLAFDGIEKEIANILAAWNWTIAQGNIQNIDKAIDGLSIYYSWTFAGEDGLEICQAANEMLAKKNLAALSTANLSEATAFYWRVYAKTLGWLGYFNLYFDHNLAAQNLEQSLSLITHLLEMGSEIRRERSTVLFIQGVLDFNAGEILKAKERFQESLQLGQEIRNHWTILRNLLLLSDVARNNGSPREAQKWSEQCLSEARAQRNPSGEISALNRLGWAARSLMAYADAKKLFEQSLALSYEYQELYEVTGAIESLGYLALFLGRLDEAIARFQEGIGVANEINLPQRTVNWQIHVGIAHWLKGDFDRAGAVIKEALSTSRQSPLIEQIFPVASYAEYLALMGSYHLASDQLLMVETLARDVFIDLFIAGRLARILGFVALAQKDYSEARIHFEQSIERYKNIADDEQIAWSQAGLARAMIGLGDWAEARQLLQEALWTVIEIQGYIPLVFTLPIVVLYLSKENPAQARSVYAQIQHAPFPFEVPLFEDIVYKYLPEEIKDLSQFVDTLPAEHDLQQRIWATASNVLFSWVQVWMDEPELAENAKTGS